eukprot:5648546-Amphidinium_carterae.2
MQGQQLCLAWDPISTGEEARPLHPDIDRNVRHARCTLGRITATDIEEQLKKVRKHSACGPDWWRPHEVRSLPRAALAMLAAIMNTMETEQLVPEPLQTGWIAPVPKLGSVSGALSIRPITLLSLIHRVWSGVRYTHLQSWMSEVLHESQSAYRPGRSSKKVLEVHNLLVQLDRRVRSGHPIFIGQIDLSKAFPRLNKEKARDLSIAAGLPPAFACHLYTACLAKRLRWKIAGVLSQPCANLQGTPQGCALSVMMFQLVMSPIARSVHNFLRERCSSSRVLLYADDMAIVTTSAALLESAMAYSVQLLETLDFTVNIDKSAVSVVGAAILPAIRIKGIPVPQQQDPDILGCTLTTRKIALPTADSLPLHTTSRTVGRLIKVKDRLTRLSVLDPCDLLREAQALERTHTACC